MIYLSHLLKSTDKYISAVDRLFTALSANGISHKLLDNTKDIWLRDFMPVKTKSGKYISFRYKPSYLDNYDELRTDFRNEVAPNLALENLVFSDINFDGGNVVFSPSKEKVIISDRVYSENPSWHKTELTAKLAKLLEANVIIIPSLKSDMTGHADGMVRFVDENTVVANAPLSPFGFETKVKKALQNHGIEVLDFPYFDSNSDSAIGCYLNFLETEQAILLPVFSVDTDNKAVQTAKHIFHKAIVPVNINEIAADGGLLNCISWET